MNKEFWAGIFVLMGLFAVGFVYVSVFVGNVASDQKIYYLDADDVTGISVGIPVMMRGYNVGEVSNIVVGLEPSLHFEVELSLQPDIPIPQDSKVLLGSRLAGGGIIDIQPPKEMGALLEEKEHLVLTPATDVQDLLETAEVILKDIEVMTRRGKEFVEDPTQGLELRLQEIDKILLEMHNVMTDTSSLIQELEKGVTQNQQAIARTMDNMEDVSEKSIEVLDSMDSTLATMDSSLLTFDKEMGAMGTLMNSYDHNKDQDMSNMIRSLEESTASLARIMKSMEDGAVRTIFRGVKEKEKPSEVTQADEIQSD